MISISLSIFKLASIRFNLIDLDVVVDEDEDDDDGDEVDDERFDKTSFA